MTSKILLIILDVNDYVIDSIEFDTYSGDNTITYNLSAFTGRIKIGFEKDVGNVSLHSLKITAN
jgi:hypothetical protein